MWWNSQLLGRSVVWSSDVSKPGNTLAAVKWLNNCWKWRLNPNQSIPVRWGKNNFIPNPYLTFAPFPTYSKSVADVCKNLDINMLHVGKDLKLGYMALTHAWGCHGGEFFLALYINLSNAKVYDPLWMKV